MQEPGGRALLPCQPCLLKALIFLAFIRTMMFGAEGSRRWASIIPLPQWFEEIWLESLRPLLILLGPRGLRTATPGHVDVWSY
jgi:hypothetical protein